MKIINNEHEREQALFLYRKLSAKTTKTKDELNQMELLSLLIEDYEQKKFPVERAKPIVLLKMIMDFRGIEPNDLVPVLGSRSHVYSILNGNKPLSKENIINLSVLLNIPMEQLMSDELYEALQHMKKYKTLLNKLNTNLNYVASKKLVHA